MVQDTTQDAPAARPNRRTAVAVAASLAAHGLILSALFLLPRPAAPPVQIEPAPIPVVLMKPVSAAPKLAGGAPAKATAIAPTPDAAPTQHISPLPTPAQAAASKTGFLELSEGQAGSGTGAGAGSGSGGGCDMAARLRSALAADNRVMTAITAATGARGATGRGMVVWNGDWVTSPGEDGKGLAAVRQAILWEVGFAPKACRQTPVAGYVVLKLSDKISVAMGAEHWRWSDLLSTPTARAEP